MDDYFDSFFSLQGELPPPGPKPGVAPANNPAILAKVQPAGGSSAPERSQLLEGGRYRVEWYPDRKVVVDTTTGQVVQSKARNSQYSTPAQQQLAKSENVQLTKQDFGKFGTQHQQRDTGLYGNGKDFNWQDFAARHGDWIDQDFQGGLPAFREAVQSKRYSKTATTWFQNQINAQLQKEGKPAYFKEPGDTDPNQIDGKFGINTFSVPRFYQPAASATPAAATPAPVDPVIPGKPTYNQAPEPDGKWWAQDLVNLAAATTDHVNKYNPVLQQERLQTPDYALLDPARQIANIQEESARVAQLAQNTSEGQVARANVLAASGQAANQVANVLGQYEQQNVSLSNQAAQLAAQTRNQETDLNTRLQDKFIAESATANQQYDNARRQLKYNQVAALNQGITNSQKQTQLEQIFPQVKVNRYSGALRFSGKGKSLEEDDPYGAGITSPEQQLDQHAKYYQTALQKGISSGMKAEDAHKFALSQLDLFQPKDNKSRQSQARQMAQAMGSQFALGGQVPDNPYLPTYEY